MMINELNFLNFQVFAVFTTLNLYAFYLILKDNNKVSWGCIVLTVLWIILISYNFQKDWISPEDILFFSSIFYSFFISYTYSKYYKKDNHLAHFIECHEKSLNAIFIVGFILVLSETLQFFNLFIFSLPSPSELPLMILYNIFYIISITGLAVSFCSIRVVILAILIYFAPSYSILLSVYYFFELTYHIRNNNKAMFFMCACLIIITALTLVYQTTFSFS